MERRGRRGELGRGLPRSPKLRLNSPRSCWGAGPGRGAAACGARRAALRPERLPRRREGRPGGRTAAVPSREGPERGAEAAAARLQVAAEVWVSARGSCLGAASGKESPTHGQTSLASLALMRRSLRLCCLAAPPPSSSWLAASSLAGWAGPGRSPRSRSRPLPVCVSCKSACSLLSKRCHRPLAAGALRLLPCAPPPPPAGALPAQCSGEGARPAGRPAGHHPAPSTPTWATRAAAVLAEARGTPRSPDLKSGGRGEEVLGNARREGPRAGGLSAARGVRSRSPHLGGSVGVAGRRGLDSQQVSAVRTPWRGPEPERGRAEGPVPGSWGPHLASRWLIPVKALGRRRRPRPWAVFILSLVRSHRPRALGKCAEEGVGGGGEVGPQKWRAGDNSDNLDNGWSQGSFEPSELSARQKMSLKDIC